MSAFAFLYLPSSQGVKGFAGLLFSIDQAGTLFNYCLEYLYMLTTDDYVFYVNSLCDMVACRYIVTMTSDPI